jgi:hypothetical protein
MLINFSALKKVALMSFRLGQVFDHCPDRWIIAKPEYHPLHRFVDSHQPSTQQLTIIPNLSRKAFWIAAP